MPDTQHKPKILLEHAGEPLFEHIVRPIDMSDRFDELVFILNLKHGQQVINYIRRHPLETPVKFVWQEKPLGFGHAVLQARDEVLSFHKWNPPVLIHTDDAVNTHMNVEKDLIQDITAQSVSQIGVQWCENVKNYGMVIAEDYVALGHAPRPNIAKSGVRVERLIEKPYWDEGGLAITGIYYVRESRRLFRCLNRLVNSGRCLGGEYQFTHALQMMVDAGTPFQTYYHEWIDCGQARKRENEGKITGNT